MRRRFAAKLKIAGATNPFCGSKRRAPKLNDLKRWTRRPVSRVLCRPLRDAAVIPLDRPLLDGSRDLPGRLDRRGPTGTKAPARRPYSVLLQAGLAMPFPSPGPRWALTPPFHPYPRPKPGRFAFCGAIPGVTPGGRYPPPLRRGARTFLDPRANGDRDRPAIWSGAEPDRRGAPRQGAMGTTLRTYPARNRCTRRARVSPSATPSTRAGRQ